MKDPILKAYLYIIAGALVAFAAMVTHVISCITAGKVGFLIAGAIMPFVGVVHGLGIWIGAW